MNTDTDVNTPSSPASDGMVIGKDGMAELVDVLIGRGFTVVGPTVRDGAIVLEELESADQLPYGWGVELEAGQYRLRERPDGAAFANAAGPQSWKTFLHPARVRQWSAARVGDETVFTADETAPGRYAFLGVRSCDLRAVAIQDRVLTGGPHRDPVYQGRRRADAARTGGRAHRHSGFPRDGGGRHGPGRHGGPRRLTREPRRCSLGR